MQFIVIKIMILLHTSNLSIIIIIIIFHTIHSAHLHTCTGWLLGDMTSVLPQGVSVNGSSLIIKAAQYIHSNTYICTAANITGQGEASANILVFGEH